MRFEKLDFGDSLGLLDVILWPRSIGIGAFMKPRKQTHSGTNDLFRSRLENIIDLRHELVLLGRRIEWAFFDEAYEAFYSEAGRPGIPTRMMVGLHILKHMFDDGGGRRFSASQDATAPTTPWSRSLCDNTVDPANEP